MTGGDARGLGRGCARGRRHRVLLMLGLGSRKSSPGSFGLSVCLWTLRLSYVPNFFQDGPGSGCCVPKGCKVEPGEPQMPTAFVEL